jgi:hypothetical protein
VRHALRAIAVVNGWSGLAAALLIVHWMLDFARVHLLGLAVLLAVALVAVLAGYSAVQLWRFRSSGRYAALGFLFLVLGLWSLALLEGSGESTWTVVARLIACVVAIALLLTRRAKAVCTSGTRTAG